MGKHKKKDKKKKSAKKHQKHQSSSESDASDSSSDWEEIRKGSRSKKSSRRERKRSSSADSSVSACSWEEPSNKGEKDIGPDVAGHSQPGNAAPQREDWLGDGDLFSMGKDYREEKRVRHQERKRLARRVDMDKPGQHQRELNPYWRDGGVGLPPNMADSSGQTSGAEASTSGSLPTVESRQGHLQWLRRSLKRLREEAGDKGLPLEVVAKERWGSLSKLESLIHEAEANAGVRRDTERYRGDERRFDGGDRRQHQGYGREREDTRRRMRRPNSDDEDEPRKSSRGFVRPRDLSDEDHDRRRSPNTSRAGSGDYGTARHHRDACHRRGGDRRSWRKGDPHRPSSPEPRWKPAHESETRTEGRQRTDEDQEKAQDKTRSSTIAERASAAGDTSAVNADRMETAADDWPREVKVLSDTELNKLAAKLLKAEMMGNGDQVEKLRKKIEVARKLREDNPDAVKQESHHREQVVVLTKTDSRGVSRPVQPVQAEDELSAGFSKRKKLKADTHNAGERLRYFADDDRASLNEMFEREKLSTAADDVAMFTRIAGRIRVKAGDVEYTVDDAFADQAARHDDSSGQKHRDTNKAIQEHQAMERVLETCPFCLESPACLKHLLISVGSYVTLSLPSFQSLTEGHCILAPTQHLAALTLADEDVWQEITRFRAALTVMFAASDEDCVFLETAMGLSSSRKPHAVLHCVPVPREVGDLLPMYYKKAILESETEWAQNKKLVDLSLKRGLRNSIPKGLPYFSVDFGTDHGFAHVIEDEREFPGHFGLEVVGGLLDREPRLWLKKQNESFHEQSRKAVKFGKMWHPYEFNEKLV